MGAVIRVMIVVNVMALVAFVYGLSLAPPLDHGTDAARSDVSTTVALTGLSTATAELPQ